MKKKTLSIIATLLLVAQGAWAQETQPWSGSGTSDDPYLIQSVADWNELADRSQTNTYEGVHFKQTSDISVATTMVGFASSPFAGIYDGGGKTTSFRLEYHDFNNEDNIRYFVAPFQYIKGATIRRLHVSGEIFGDLHVSGLVGDTADGDNDADPPTNTIEDCRVSADIWSYNTHAGGFIGHGEKAKNILKGCIFDGTIRSMYQGDNPTYAAPFIGWCEYAADDRSTLQGCFEKGTYASHHSTGIDNTALYFVLKNISYPDLTTSGVVVDRTFHSQNWNDNHHGYTVTSGTDGLSLEYQFEAWYKDGYSGINCTNYATSGITYYGSPYATGDADITLVGIVYDNKLYLANGDRVNFYPKSESTDYKYTNFSTTSGSLETNDSYCSLTMGAANSVITASPYVELRSDSESNSSILSKTNSMTGVTVKLNNRTLSKDGCWNTLCLPFGVALAGSPLADATVKELTSASFSGGTLTLNFSDNLSAIEAGKPYIVKWTKPENYAADEHDIVAPVFDGVTINSSEPTPITSTDGSVSFVGTYNLIDIGNGGDDTKLYLGAGDKLYYPTGQMKISAFQSYFQLADGITAGDRTDGIRSIVLNFGDEATGINNVQWSTDNGQWSTDNGQSEAFTLDGRRLTGMPTAKGIYIYNGRKVVIK